MNELPTIYRARHRAAGATLDSDSLAGLQPYRMNLNNDTRLSGSNIPIEVLRLSEPRVYLFLSLPAYRHQVYKLATVVPAGEVAYWTRCLASAPFKVLLISSGKRPNRSRLPHETSR